MQELGLALGEPLALQPRPGHFRAVAVAAGIVGDTLVRAVLRSVSTGPPSAAVAAGFPIADMTFNSARPTWTRVLAFRQAAPWARGKTSATSRRGRAMRPWSGGRRSAQARLTPSRSSGLLMSRIVLTATRV